MPKIDNIVNGKDNHICIPIAWWRFRDDVYAPWIHGLEKLIQFDKWINGLENGIKFEMRHSTQGVEYLDTYIYDVDGELKTKLYSKPSDTHAYLPPTSCHPYHILKNNPDQVARRVRKLSNCDIEYNKARKEYSQHLKIRGYSTE